MEVELIKDMRNEPMDRREVEAVIRFEGATPPKDSILVELAKKLKVDETHIEVDKVWQRFGRQEAKVLAFIYSKPVRKKGGEKKETVVEEEKAKAGEQPSTQEGKVEESKEKEKREEQEKK